MWLVSAAGVHQEMDKVIPYCHNTTRVHHHWGIIDTADRSARLWAIYCCTKLEKNHKVFIIKKITANKNIRSSIMCQESNAALEVICPSGLEQTCSQATLPQHRRTCTKKEKENNENDQLINSRTEQTIFFLSPRTLFIGNKVAYEWYDWYWPHHHTLRTSRMSRIISHGYYLCSNNDIKDKLITSKSTNLLVPNIVYL